VIAVFYGAFHRRFALDLVRSRRGDRAGSRVRLWDFLFYAAFAWSW
jgi:hypothetical protein